MFDRGTKGWFLRTLSPLNLTAEPGVGSCARWFLDTGGGGVAENHIKTNSSGLQ